jgi:hypothetical protein
MKSFFGQILGLIVGTMLLYYILVWLGQQVLNLLPKPIARFFKVIYAKTHLFVGGFIGHDNPLTSFLSVFLIIAILGAVGKGLSKSS